MAILTFDEDKKEPQAKTSPGVLTFDDLTPGSVGQEAGPVPSREGLKTLLPTKEELPELVLSMAGGLAKRTPAGIALSAGGAMAGEAIRQKFLSDEELTPKERFKKLGFAGVRGVIGEGAGLAVGKLFHPFSGSVTPEIEAGRKSAESVGIKPPLSAITEAKTPQALERFTEVSPFGGKITEQKNNAIKQFGIFADSVGAGIAPDKPSELVGELAEKSVQNFEKIFRATKDTLYDAVMPIVRNVPPILMNTIDTLKGIIKRRETSVGSDTAFFEEFLDNLIPKESTVKRAGGRFIPAKEKVISEGIPGILQKEEKEIIYSKFIRNFFNEFDVPRYKGGAGLLLPEPVARVNTFELLRKLRTKVSEKIMPLNQVGRTGMAREFKVLRDAITRDLDATASSVSADVASGLKEADKFFAIGINKLKDRLIPIIQRTAQREPSKLHKVLIRKDSPELIKAGREILGDEAFNDIKRQWFEGVIENSKSVIEGLEVLSPQKLSNNIRRFGSTIDEVFSDNPAQKEAFEKLTEISNLLTRGKQITSGSQTAYIQSIANMFNVFQLPQTILTGMAAGLVRTGTGRELLTRGFPKVGKAAERTVQPLAQSALQQSSKSLGEIVKSLMPKKSREQKQ